MIKLTQYRRLKGAVDKLKAVVSEVWYCAPDCAMIDAGSIMTLIAKYEVMLREFEAANPQALTVGGPIPAELPIDPRTPAEQANDAAILQAMSSIVPATLQGDVFPLSSNVASFPPLVASLTTPG